MSLRPARSSRWPAAVILVLLLGFASVLRATPASAVRHDALRHDALHQDALRLVEQTAYVNADGEFSVEFAWTGIPVPETTVVFRLYQPTLSASQLGEAGTAANVLTVPWEVPIEELERTALGHFVLTVPLRSFADATSTSESLYLPGSGVHPASITIETDGTTVGRLDTHLIHLPGDATTIEPVPVAIVLPVTQADGLATGLTVSDTTAILDRHPDVPVAVEVGVGVLSQLSVDNELADAFRRALGSRTVIVSPGFNLDPSALSEINQGTLFTQSIEAARNQARNLGLRPATNVFPWDGTITTAGIDLLDGLGIDIMLASADSSMRSGQLAGSSAVIDVARPNGDLSTELDVGANAVTRAYELLAELALLTEQDRSPILLGGDGFQRLDRRSLEILLTAWEGLGPVEPVTLEEGVRQFPDRDLRAAELPEQNLVPLQDTIAQIDASIQTYASYYLSGGAEPARFRTSLISALSRERNPDDRRLRVNQISTNVEEAFSPVTVLGSQEFTLTTNRFALPLQLQNDAPGPRLVHLRFQSDKIKVFTDDTYTTDTADTDLVVTLDPGATTIMINVEAQTIGRSPVDVVVLTPDGQRQLAAGTFAIRSTAIPGLGLLLSGAAGLFLVVWWLGHHRRERRTEANGAEANETEPSDSVSS